MEKASDSVKIKKRRFIIVIKSTDYALYKVPGGAHNLLQPKFRGAVRPSCLVGW